MAEEKPVEGEGNNTEKGGAPAKTGENTPTLEEELAAERKERNKLSAELRKAKDRLKELETATNKRDEDAAAEKGDVEALRKAAKKREEELETQISELRGKLRTSTLESTIKSLVAEHAFKPDQAWRLLKDDFDVVEEDGQTVVRVKESTLSPEKYVLKFFDENPNLAKSKRAGGSGAQKGAEVEHVAEGYPSNWDSFSKADKTAWFAKNPKFVPKF